MLTWGGGKVFDCWVITMHSDDVQDDVRSACGRVVDASGELYSLQCRSWRSHAWRRSVCEVGVSEFRVVVGRRRCGGCRCWRCCLLVALAANCCDTWRPISRSSERSVLSRWRPILSRCVGLWAACHQWRVGKQAVRSAKTGNWRTFELTLHLDQTTASSEWTATVPMCYVVSHMLVWLTIEKLRKFISIQFLFRCRLFIFWQLLLFSLEWLSARCCNGRQKVIIDVWKLVGPLISVYLAVQPVAFSVDDFDESR